MGEVLFDAALRDAELGEDALGDGLRRLLHVVAAIVGELLPHDIAIPYPTKGAPPTSCVSGVCLHR